MGFVVDAPPAGCSPEVFGGPEVEIHTEAAPAPASTTAGNIEGIDHVVVQSDDPDRAIALWRDRMGLRLALDRVFDDRGLRLVFFRSGGITLEYASPHPPPAARGDRDRFYGLSYRVLDLALQRERLLAAGVDVSPVRPGIRPGTSVVTVRSGTAGVPTLLLQLDAGARAA
jgi:catechol 2,3-dioxygenase-like lactoylglutathione lyase family enzyme